MREARSVLLCGATGLVGRECLRLLSTDQVFGRIVVLTRRPLAPELRRGFTASVLEEHIVDFARVSALAALFQVDQIVCALGATIKQTGSEERFREVDFGYPLAIARVGAEQGVDHFLLVSALGANARSRIFYYRVKGELEQAICALPYRGVTLVRPSLLVGDRAEPRLAEEIGKRLSFLAPTKYKPVTGTSVAAALLRAARENLPGRRIIESGEIRSVADAYFASSAA